MNVSNIIIAMHDFSKGLRFHKGCENFNKIFLMEFYHSSVDFCHLKCGTCVFRKPENCWLCSSGRITISLVFFARESDLVLMVLFQVVFSNQKTSFLDILYFWCLFCNKRGCLFQCVVSNFYLEDRKLIFCVRSGMGIDRLV